MKTKEIGGYALGVAAVGLYLYALAHDIYTSAFGRFAFDFVFPPAGVAHALWILI